jgi:hypothetical protein
MKWEHYRNLRRRPAKPTLGRGRLQRQVRRACCRRADDIRERNIRLVLCEAPAGARQAADDAASVFGMARVESTGRQAGRPCRAAPCDPMAIAGRSLGPLALIPPNVSCKTFAVSQNNARHGFSTC